jgi:hypothetical protein
LQCLRLQLEDSFWTHDATVFDALNDMHIWAPSFKEKRLAVREGRPVTALLLRVWNFEAPVLLPQDKAFWGCFSWGACRFPCRTFWQNRLGVPLGLRCARWPLFCDRDWSTIYSILGM